MFRRSIEAKIRESLTFMPVTLVRGARQTGKTTLVKNLAAELGYIYLSLDNLPTLLAAQSDPVEFIARLQKPVVIDEIQRVPELFLPIKQDVDQHRTTGRYILTGSADPLLVPHVADSLAGRMQLLDLFPLSQGEVEGVTESFLERVFNPEPFVTGIQRDCSKADVLKRVVCGGYPGPMGMSVEAHRYAWVNDYLSLVLQKDILDLARIENMSQIPNLFMLIASRSGSILNIDELSRTLKLSSTTTVRYLELLKTLFLVHEVLPWNNNIGRRLVKSPKVYLNDTALQIFALHAHQDRLQTDPFLVGSLVESFVVLELLKHISWHVEPVQIFHYRDYQQAEVDIMLEGPRGTLVAIEVKASESVSHEDFKSLKLVQKHVGTRLVHGIVLYAGTQQLAFGPQLTALPIATLWA